MATLNTNINELFSEICDEIRLFFPVKSIDCSREKMDPDFNMQLFFREDNNNWYADISLYLHSSLQKEQIFTGIMPAEADENTLLYKKLRKRFIKNSVYRFLKEYTGITQPWGSLTGIRPTKLVREIALKNEFPYEYLKNTFDVSDNKISVLKKIAAQQTGFLDSRDDDIDIYIGIPFCKSRCSYCSFVSSEYENNLTLKDEYLQSLNREMESLSVISETYNVRALYIGGGTPTALSDSEFEALLECVDKFFPERTEYTVEAGRADTLSASKFASMKSHGVSRISINPQTTSDKTLSIIGRDYKTRLFYKVFKQARKAGFDNINSDIIFGLPEENVKTMLKTLSDVIKLGPENITVHTLAIKNSSRIALDYMGEGNLREQVSSGWISDAVEKSVFMLETAGYNPYYMYRQKYMSGNHENIGYSLPGKICRYNIDNMEETTNVLALGSGGISKRIFSDENRIERSVNVKDIRNFCSRTDEMIMRNKTLFSIDT